MATRIRHELPKLGAPRFGNKAARGALSAAIFAIILAAPPAAATEEQSAARYAACLLRAQVSPEVALADARAWMSAGGAGPARHCEATALFGGGRFAEAGAALEALAHDLDEGETKLRAAALGQAGRAWLLAGESEKARAAITAALALRPENVEFLIDRAIVQAEAGHFWEAIDDLNRAIELAPTRADAHAFRASAYRRVDSLELAVADAKQALALDPDNAEALLERGILHRMRGDEDAALAAWRRLLRTAPDGPAADAARRNLSNGG
ncbi:MAG: tetratricopeptide repeat protein [Alphaproteobacteria bacterium]